MNLPTTLLRHAEAERPQGLCLGQWEHPLSQRGINQVTALARRWAGPVPAHILSSDIGRAHQTAELLALHLGAPQPVLEPRLREISMGEWEGQAWDDIYTHQRAAVDHWGEHWVSHGPPGGESAEQVETRMREVLGEIAPGTLLVGHRGALGILLCSLAGQPLCRAFDYEFAHAAPVCVD